jgi:hypothetical protein
MTTYYEFTKCGFPYILPPKPCPLILVRDEKKRALRDSTRGPLQDIRQYAASLPDPFGSDNGSPE